MQNRQHQKKINVSKLQTSLSIFFKCDENSKFKVRDSFDPLGLRKS